jgi:SAM-dependent methyltransferase
LIPLDRRATDKEELDEGVSPEEAHKSLADLRFVNRWLSNRHALWNAVSPHLTGRRPTILDVGCGSGDVVSWIRERSGGRTMAVGVDIKLLHLQVAPHDIHRVVADVHGLPFAAHSFDVVMTSLFLHHFDAPQVADVLEGLYRLARRALVVNDLRRARVPFEFGRLAFPLMFKSRVSVEDGLISIRRAFREDEMHAAFSAARIPVQITRCWPYRLLAVAERVDT